MNVIPKLFIAIDQNDINKAKDLIQKLSPEICGIKIGQYAFVAAGAVVNRDVAAHALMIGVPAKRCGWMCVCGVQLKGQGRVVCQCGKEFEINDSECLPL